MDPAQTLFYINTAHTYKCIIHYLYNIYFKLKYPSILTYRISYTCQEWSGIEGWTGVNPLGVGVQGFGIVFLRCDNNIQNASRWGHNIPPF